MEETDLKQICKQSALEHESVELSHGNGGVQTYRQEREADYNAVSVCVIWPKIYGDDKK